MTLPLISKPFKEFTPEEYHAHVKGMYALRKVAKPKKAPGPAPGLSVKLTKKGAISIARAKKTRAFDYVLKAEIDALAQASKLPLQDLWTAFKQKGYIVADNKMDAERTHASILGVPWEV